MDVFHNPKAKYPLDPAMLPGAAHHRLMSDGKVQSTARVAADGIRHLNTDHGCQQPAELDQGSDSSESDSAHL